MSNPLVRLLTALFWGIAATAPAQDLLEINLSNRCIFRPQGQEEELYSFSTRVAVMQNLVNEILQRGGDLEQNFQVVQANVENVSAVVDGQKRYLLWSQDFLEKASPAVAFASVAHEIGHHASLHLLTADRRQIEESEADFFMGYVMGMKAFDERVFSGELLEKGIFGNAPETRLPTILKGFKKAENALRLEAVPFDDDQSWINFQKAAFPFPPPQCFQSAEIGRETFFGCQNLGEVGKKISRAFEQKGYPARFLSVPDGFAVVTQLEQYQADGSIFWDSRNRWHEMPPAEKFSFSIQYFKSLVLPRRAHLRVFVVLVTRQNFSSRAEFVSKESAKAWISLGVNRLPKAVAVQAFNSDFSVDLLVYEFEVPETNHKPEQHCPCHLDAWTHLQKAGLNFKQ